MKKLMIIVTVLLLGCAPKETITHYELCNATEDCFTCTVTQKKDMPIEITIIGSGKLAVFNTYYEKMYLITTKEEIK